MPTNATKPAAVAKKSSGSVNSVTHYNGRFAMEA